MPLGRNSNQSLLPVCPVSRPTCPTNEKIDHQAATSTPPTARDDVKEGECSSAVASATIANHSRSDDKQEEDSE
ncbi:unnamed protein product [Acanthoscelides obtectus]|uniref:Uncharacterized protein n=1 Tax=Acanthoscelides obtectus TaxID=200917 RepID=A0A9P0VTW9_ACAOB|nr:unnamed protein product [Acanthoscelides obtectus]CAK1683453.1 hypothetical protein AOBTE_LOCUS34260 [Acanthoscelides obtectus]